nr:hypothetical protein [Tanacetum cinerariifolium]
LIEDDDEEVEEDEVDDVDDEDDEDMEVDKEDEDNGMDDNDNEDEAEVIHAYEEVDPLNRPPPTSDEETEVAARLDKQMFDRCRTEKKIEKKFKEDEFHMNGNEYDITALDVANRQAEQLSRWEAQVKELLEKLLYDTFSALEVIVTNPKVATLGLKVANGKPWAELKKMMIDEFFPTEEKILAKNERVAEGNKRRWENNNQGGNNNHNNNNNNNNHNNRDTKCAKYNKMGHKAEDCRVRGVATGRCGNATGRAYALRDAKQSQRPNVVTSTFLLNNRYARLLFDSSLDKSFVNSGFSHLIDIKPVRLNISYEVELTDGKLVNTNTIIRGCTLNLGNWLFEIDLKSIELGTFDVIIGMDWLVKHDALIVCEKKEVHIPVKGNMLVVKGNYDKEPKEKRLEDVPIIRDFPKAFPDDLPGLPSPRQVEFRIKLVPQAAPVA